MEIQHHIENTVGVRSAAKGNMAHPMAALLVCALTVISLWGHGVSGSAKSEFLQRLKAETGELGSLSTATAQNEYADYVERFGKLSGYMASDFDVKAHFAAYCQNSAEIVGLNAAARHEDEHYSVNEFTDMTMEEKKAMLIPLGDLASRRRMGWADVDDCITVSHGSLPTDASSRSGTEMALNACGSVKSQGRLGSCWYVAVDCIVSRERQHALDPLLRSKGRSRRRRRFSAITTRRWPATKCSAKSMPPTAPTRASAP